jgi:hypothetical protein
MRLIRSAAFAALLSCTHVTAVAQRSPEQALASINRLLSGAGDSMVFTSGRVLDTAHAEISNVRTAGSCRTTYEITRPNHPDLPENYRGKHETDGEVKWDKVTGMHVAGSRVYYDHPRAATGRQFTYHFQMASSADAAELAEAARAVIAACQGEPESDPQELMEATHDPRGNTASLAIDRRNGSRYGWAIDYPNVGQSDERALAECSRDGSSCQIVLRFTGGCGAYAADSARGSTAYGWGTAPSRSAAESRARDEARKRGGTNVGTRVWGCNSVKAGGASGASASAGTTQRGSGLSEEVARRNADAQRAHQATVDRYEQQLKDNQAALEKSVADRKVVEEAHQRELAKARAAQEEFERRRQAYREEYKRITGRYPDE